MRLWSLALCLAGSLALSPAALGDEYQDLVDLGTKHLWDRQLDDGSYGAGDEGEVEMTARVLIALRRSPRRYELADGPLVRRPMEWLDSQFDEQGRCRIGDPQRRAIAAAWCVQAVDGLRSETAVKLVERCRRFLAPIRLGTLDGEWGLDGTQPAAAEAEATEALHSLEIGLTGSLRDCGRSIPWMERLAEIAPDARMTVQRGGEDYEAQWAEAVGQRLASSLDWPQGLKSLETGTIVDVCRVLSLCNAHARPDPPGGGPPSLGGARLHTLDSDLDTAYQKAAARSLEYLATQQSEGRFEYFGRADAGVTAMALAAVIRTSRRIGEPLAPWVDQGLDWLVSLQDEEGAIHAGGLKVYITSAAVLALSDAARGGDDVAVIEKANAYLLAVQSDGGEGFDEADTYYGGIGYGGDLRPDLSNTQFAVEAWAESGAEGREQGYKKAMVFLQRCQNNPESNDKVIERDDGRKIEPGTDGGAMYYPGNSKAGLIELENGNFVARSYGSMTYALLKCYLLCGLPDDDPRVKAALNWIQENYTLEYNPGLDQSDNPTARYQGLYYYYFSMAKALDASGLEVVKTPDNMRHVWREEMIRHLLRERFREGYWANDRSSRWWEELPALATSYTLVALDHCYGHFPKKEK